jgi:uncharacterized delta-60 repeat protein
VLARFTARGALDRSFGTEGKVIPGFDVAAVAVQADGQIVALGAAAGDFALARYNPDGSLDTSFGSSGKVTTRFGPYGAGVASGGLQSDGKIVAAGANEIYTGVRHRFALARYTPEGELDLGFGNRGQVTTHFGQDGCKEAGGSDEAASALAIQADGRSVAAGSTTAGSICDYLANKGDKGRFFALARYRTDGSPDPTFGTGGKVVTRVAAYRPSGAHAVVVQADGKIVASGGCLRTDDDFALVRYTPRGNLDRSFGVGGKVLTDFTRR